MKNYVLLKFLGTSADIRVMLDPMELHVVREELWDNFTDTENRDRLWERVGEGTFDEMHSLAKLVNRS